MLADDEKKTLIEPIGDHKDSLPLLYDGELMLGGGHLYFFGFLVTQLLLLISPLTFQIQYNLFAAKKQKNLVCRIHHESVRKGSFEVTLYEFFKEDQPS